MAITTYAELQTAIANWLERDDLTARIPEFIALCEDRLALDLRVRAMEATTDLTISAQNTALPTGFVGVRRLYLDNDPQRIEFMPPEHFWNTGISQETGTPKAFTIEGGNLVVAPAPDVTYTGKLLYWKRLTAFSGSTDTNDVLTSYRGLYLYGSLFEAAVYLEDDAAAAKFARMYEDVLARVNKSDSRDRFPVGVVSRSEVAKI